jgi:hypothetical protein
LHAVTSQPPLTLRALSAAVSMPSEVAADAGWFRRTLNAKKRHKSNRIHAPLDLYLAGCRAAQGRRTMGEASLRCRAARPPPLRVRSCPEVLDLFFLSTTVQVTARKLMQHVSLNNNNFVACVEPHAAGTARWYLGWSQADAAPSPAPERGSMVCWRTHALPDAGLPALLWRRLNII